MQPGKGLTTGAAVAPASYWLIYPVTLLECALMGILSALCYVLWRVTYSKWWYPERARQRPARMFKQAIDSDGALGAMQVIERIGRESRAGVFWISGTLLGLERLGRPLPHDNDLDLGICLDDPHCQDFIQAMRAAPDVVSVAPQLISRKIQIQNPDLQMIPGCIIRYKSVVQNCDLPGSPPIKADIFLHFAYRGGIVHGSRNTLWWNTPVSSVQKTYGERSFFVPENSHAYLSENYGDYKSEVKDFENSIDCPNAMDIFSWRSLAYLLSRQQMMLRMGRIERARQIAKRVKTTILKGAYPLFLRNLATHRGS